MNKNLELSAIGFATIDTERQIVSANALFYSLLGFAEPQAQPMGDLVKHLANVFKQDFEALDKKFQCPDAFSIELHTLDHRQAILIQAAATDHALRMLIVCALADAAPVNIAQISTAMSHDPLTGLGNRALLEHTLSHWHATAQPSSSLAILMIDLDRFKHVNDTLGHAAGDNLLKLVSKRIQSVIRTEDIIIRMGGDEFVILQSISVQPDNCLAIAKRIVELLSRPFLLAGQQVNIGACVGIALLQNGDSVNDLLKHANLALDLAKANGRGNVEFFQPMLAHRAAELHNLEIDLRRALCLKQYQLLYQPQISLSDGSLRGFEALVRWRHPVRGLVSPADFIPLAEQTGEIHSLGEWVLRTACLQAMTWAGDFSVSVNVSPIQFEDDRIVDIIQKALEFSGLPPERLEIEVTEGILMKDRQSVEQHLTAIKAMGVGIAMDDFGTGYSSLSYLNHFPFTKLKIDQSFVRGPRSEKSSALIKAIISLGESLKMITIAEGVETNEQFEELASYGCLQAQGYLISRPMAASDIASFVAQLRAANGFKQVVAYE